MKAKNIFSKMLMGLRKLLIEDRGISINDEIRTGKPELDRIVKEYMDHIRYQ
jgi:hypothetical protein